jgi:2-polyprenyl-3-methyl-5-hydroxy-6-metoxy-1,4-benzoquinol methylase
MQSDEAAWYDEFYRQEQTKFAPWYRFSIPHLRGRLTGETRLIDLGCGQGHLLRHLAREKLLSEENLYGLDQSATALNFVKKWLPKAHVQVGDIYRLDHPKDFFHVCFLMETIEHLEEPVRALEQIRSIIVPGGLLYLSFPNFLHLPWLAVRLLSDLLNKPNWIVRQPIDKIYTVPEVIKLVKQAGFEFERGIGSNYGPPVLYPLEKPWVTNSLNTLGFWWLSFHPILIFRKPNRSISPSEHKATEK